MNVADEAERDHLRGALGVLIAERVELIAALSEIESVSTDQHAVGIAKAALAKVEE